jgi:Ca2+-binding RTX toxin-like protein
MTLRSDLGADEFGTAAVPDAPAGVRVAQLAEPLVSGEVARAGAGVGEPIGRVATLDGAASATRVDGTIVDLGPDAPIHQGDVVATGARSALAIVFVDGTSFSLGADARMVIDAFVYDPAGDADGAAFGLLEGAFVFVSGEVAKAGPEAMTLTTPVATIGIRGTALALQLLGVGLENLIALLADPEGHVGEVTVATDEGAVILNDAYEATQVTSRTAEPGQPYVLDPIALTTFFGELMRLLRLSYEGPTEAETIEVASDAVEVTTRTEDVAFAPRELPPPEVGTDFVVNEFGQTVLIVPSVIRVGEDEIRVVGGRLIIGPTDPIFGTNGDDHLIGNGFDNFASGKGGDDVIDLLGGNDTAFGGDGDDSILGGDGDDLLFGESNLPIEANPGDDHLLGEAGNDALFGGIGDDVLSGGAGDDVLQGGSGVDTYDGGTGIDRASFADAGGPVDVDLAEFTVNDDGHGDSDSIRRVENLDGGQFDDTLGGDAADNRLFGSEGDDILDGAVGSDVLEGGAGRDSLTGGLGESDTFRFETPEDGTFVPVNGASGPAGDTIADVEPGVDVLSFGLGFDPFGVGAIVDGVNFTTIAGPYDGTNAVGSAAFAAGEAAFVFSTSNHTLSFDVDGAADGYTVVAVLANGATLTAGDLQLAA